MSNTYVSLLSKKVFECNIMTARHRATHLMIKLNINEVNKYSFLRYTLDAELRSERCNLIINNQKKKNQKSRKSEQH